MCFSYVFDVSSDYMVVLIVVDSFCIIGVIRLSNVHDIQAVPRVPVSHHANCNVVRLARERVVTYGDGTPRLCDQVVTVQAFM